MHSFRRERIYLSVFTGLCLSTGRGGGGVHPLPGIHTPWAVTPLGQTPPPPEMATAADGTHPTGMHSYLKKTSQHNRTLKTDFRSVLKQINLKKSSYLSSGRALTASTHTAKFCLLPINFCSESTTCC